MRTDAKEVSFVSNVKHLIRWVSLGLKRVVLEKLLQNLTESLDGSPSDVSSNVSIYSLPKCSCISRLCFVSEGYLEEFGIMSYDLTTQDRIQIRS